MKNRFAIAAAAAFGLAAVFYSFGRDSATLNLFGAVALWLGVGALLIYAALRRSLTTWIFAGMIFGGVFGHTWPRAAAHAQILSQIFLQLIKTVIAPLLFATLVTGIAGHADLKKVGRMGIKSLIYFELITTLALVIGLAAINISRAGVGVKLGAATAVPQSVPTRPSGAEIILHAFPENIAKSVAEGQVLQVVIFAILFGIALALVNPVRQAPMLQFCDSLAEVMFKFTNIVMLFAPVGVGAAIAYTVSQGGLTVLGSLARLVLTLYAALAFLLLLLVPIVLLTGVPLGKFLRAIAEPTSIAFGTASSEAALPRAMEAMEALGVPRQIVAFVIPTGYSFNLVGSTLYLSLAAVFCAQVAGIPLTWKQEVIMLLTLMLTSKGVAGVSKASLVILLGAADSLGIPTQPVLLLFAVDQLMDMARTAVNVIGNCLATVVVARWEGEMKPQSEPAMSTATP